MTVTCPKCGRNAQDDAIYCPYCGHGLTPSARTTQVSIAGTLLIVAGVASLTFLVLSIRALLQIFNWLSPNRRPRLAHIRPNADRLLAHRLHIRIPKQLTRLHPKKPQINHNLLTLVHSVWCRGLDNFNDSTPREPLVLVPVLFSTIIHNRTNSNDPNLSQKSRIHTTKDKNTNKLISRIQTPLIEEYTKHRHPSSSKNHSPPAHA